MRNKHITRFGNPTTRSGARYFVADEEGLFQMAVDFEFARLNHDGLIITPSLKSRVIDSLRRDQLIYDRNVVNQGIPGNLKTLLQISEKSEAVSHCRRLIISEFELFLLIRNCNQINFEHQSKFPEYIPNHLVITENDRANLKKGNLGPFTKKIIPLFMERRRINVHLFQRDSEWHCFYFSYEDIDPSDNNHWTRGCHLHYVSHLWPNHTKEHIWNTFDIRSTNIPGNIHIRFTPFDYSDTSKGKKDSITTRFEQPPKVFAFNSDLAYGYGSESIPIPQVATRGFLVLDLSTVN